MKQSSRSTSLRQVAAAVLSAIVLTLAIGTTLPLRAAESSSERAVKQRVPPVYPELAKRMRVSGVVRVAATVTPSGEVKATKTVSGNRMLSGAAEEAVLRWKFVPADTESTVEVEVSFAMAQ